ncbi:DUF4142 domain-containing protein [Amycolatopsis sp. BJA-103]|uniref:DUF4142 domain-containing protein n=1 Tax=Amycolatopsis sp. BJA-103 TaxID=1911175 RepID=UPI000C772EE5|nr:DUF4142 domain-containing protein [Amycolatopsis sp. BJA-103]AUI57672.1 hypothetical protein BKN51_05155 [Amycolatopsis sp. BJA-103]PNE14328.1 hypothetical protein B1H26_36925 [Amycolatopsis sp. BJA-103]
MTSASDTPPAFSRLLIVLLTMAAVTLLGPADDAHAQELSAADKNLIVNVKLAGLWEMPAGMWAQERGKSKRTREVGRTLMIDHGRLDTATHSIADRFGIPLPSEPSDQQSAWLGEMKAARDDTEFDRIFANRLRYAHGVLFPIIAQVRAGTRNDVVRDYATTANQAVLRHMTLLESTGVVDQSLMPEAPVPQSNSANAAMDVGFGDLALGLLLAVVLGGGLFFAIRTLRSKNTRTRKRAAAAEPELVPSAPGEINV